MKNREKDEEGARLIFDRGHLCKEKPQQGQDGEGLNPALIMGHFQMKSQSIRTGGHGNSPVSQRDTVEIGHMGRRWEGPVLITGQCYGAI